jgi:hypothetical protein
VPSISPSSFSRNSGSNARVASGIGRASFKCASRALP